MKRYLSYVGYLLRHTSEVRRACWKSGLFWQGIVHDLSKWRLDEAVPYAKFFYEKDGSKRQRRDTTGYYKPTDTGDAAFDFAWLLHQKRNKHHWQYWICPQDDGGFKTFPMPRKYVLEMLCDWYGASMAQGYGGDLTAWYAKNRDKMMMHSETRALVDANHARFEAFMKDRLGEHCGFEGFVSWSWV